MAAIIVEERNRMGHVVNRHRVEHLPASIGRGFNNDIIVDDPYVSPNHIVLEDSASMCVRVKDSDSLNGITRHGVTTLGESMELSSGQEIVLGRTRLRFYSLDHEIIDTRPIKNAMGFAVKWAKPVPLTMFLILFFTMLLAEVLFSAKQDASFEKGLAEFLVPIIIVVIWAAIWAFVGRLIKHQPQFRTHVIIFVLYLLATNFISWLIGVLEFNLIAQSAVNAFEIVVMSLLTIWLLTNHLRQSTALLKFVRVSSASVFVLSIAGLYLLSGMVSERQFLHRPNYSIVIKAPYAKIRSDTPVNTYLAESQKIFDIDP